MLAARRDATAAPLLAVVVVGYLWYLLSTLALLARTTLLAFRMESVLVETMALAGVFGGAALWRALPAALGGRPSLAGHRPELRGLAVLACAAVFVVPLQATGQNLAGPIAKAYGDYSADGTTALGESDESLDGAWTDDLISTIGAAGTSRGLRPDQLVVLSTYYEVFSFQPYRGFQQITPHYANPLADYDARRSAVESWARATSPADLLQRLADSPFPAPDVFVLRATADGYQIGLARDTFPAEPNVAWTTVTFDPALFEDPAFTTTTVGPFAVLARTGSTAPA